MIISMGGTSLIKGIKSKLETQFEINIEIWELLSSNVSNKITLVNNTDKSIDTSFGQCAGLSIKEVFDI
jgi:hypothetical protein